MTPRRALPVLRNLIAASLFVFALPSPSDAQTSVIPGIPQINPEATGPARLRQPLNSASMDARAVDDAVDEMAPRVPERPYVPGEFERFVQALAGSDVEVRRFGSDLVTGAGDTRGLESSPLVPADYVVGPGDEVLVTLWGSVDADLRLVVDRTGRINIPRVGAIQVAGVRHENLADVVNGRVAQTFRNFQSSVSLGRLRAIRVFVTGFVLKPGVLTVSSLSTLVGALMRAGGPSAAGSFRNIELRRGSTLVGRFDLYDLLLKGDRSADRPLQAGDVVHVGAVGPQVGFVGSVTKPGVLELMPNETVADALRMAGGFSAVADRTRLSIERLQERNTGRVSQLELPRDERSSLAPGDVLRAFSAVAVALPSQRQSKRIRVEGEVVRPGDFVLPESSTVNDAIQAAGGFASAAFVFATELTRLSVQRTQQENYDRALRDLETDLARAAGTQRITTAEEASTQSARAAGTARLIERLRALRPSGRIVLQMPVDATTLPDLVLEDGDRIYIPARPTTVGVVGSVFNAANYLHQPGRSIQDYLRLAGGPTKGADEDSIFVIRANGNVVGGRQRAGSWFGTGDHLTSLGAEPGDTVFVPEEMNKATFVQTAKDWTQIVYQFGLGVAGLVAATR